AQTGVVKKLGEKPRAGDDRGTNTTCGLDVRDRLLDSSGGDQDLTGTANATAILRMKQNPASTQKIKSFDVAPLVSARSEPSTCPPLAWMIKASGVIPLPPMPQKK